MKQHDPADAPQPGWLMSALADGEADAAELARGCQLFAAEASARECWHDYHLIGDVLRSQDLASGLSHDQDFLRRLSARLDREPAVLAPVLADRGAAPARRRWAVPAAVAASVTALVAAAGLWPQLDRTAPAPSLAAAPASAAPTVAAVPAAAPQGVLAQRAPAAAEPVATGGRVLRDARLDRYLRAHREYAAALPGSLPGGSARGIATVSFER